MTNDYGNLELHTVLLSAMKDIDKICRENGLKYYLYAGTLLGALNHKGFIPWDDDVDIVMFESDFLKFCHVIEQKYTSVYRMMTFDNTLNWYSKMSKLQVEGTSLIHMNNTATPLFIDISILHGVPDSRIARYFQRKEIEYYNLALGVLSGEIIPSSWITKCSIALTAKKGKLKLGQRLDKILSKYDDKCTEWVGIMCNTLTCNPYTGVSGYENDCTKREWHEHPIYLPFEDTEFMTISEPIRDLEHRYGPHWHEPYPEEKRITKHDVKSYEISEEVRKRVGL